MSARPTGGLAVRGRTITGGIGLAAALLLGVALIGGADDRPADPEPPVPEHLGPLTAIQPQLRQALFTDDEPVLPTRSPAARTGLVPGSVRPEPAPADPPGSVPPALAELCRALLEDPTGLAELWSTAPPREVTAQQTPRGDGATLHQMLGVFDAEHAPAAFGRLREVASDCDRLPVTLSDGTQVIMLLRELAPDPAGHEDPAEPVPGAARQPESATVPDPGVGTGYAAAITVESAGAPRGGWLSLDRVGPVVSVLSQLGPLAPPGTEADDEVAGDLAETRRSALGKLRRLLEALPGWPTGTG